MIIASLALLLFMAFNSALGASVKQKFFVNTKAINFVDAMKHGFRVVLLDSFVQSYLSETQMPTLFITAIPLKSDDSSITMVEVPDQIRDDKQVTVKDLRERSWYYICVEWENINRYNESTGTDCRILRTLDRFGKNAESTVPDIDMVDIGATAMHFKIRSIVDFPIRLTAFLQGGIAPVVPAQVFVFRESTDINIMFASLKEDTNYGELCILEEPLASGYTALGRHIGGMNIRRCYFANLQTKDYELSTAGIEAFPLRRAVSSSPPTSSLFCVVSLLVCFLVHNL